MSKPKNAMEIFRLLDKSNCGQCGEKTCLAFAGAVFKGLKDLQACPKLDRKTIEQFSGKHERFNIIEENRLKYLQQLKEEIAEINLAEAAERVGGEFSENKLSLRIMGKKFSVDSKGNLYADIHINPWVAVPFFNYVLHGQGLPVSGNWITFRELKGGSERYPLFKKRCEESLKRVADVYTDLFDDMVHIFSGKQVEEHFKSDISVVLHPLPKVPIMVCYWKPEEGLESSLNIFFDQTADQNLDIGSIFSLSAGLAQMFEKLAIRHGFSQVSMDRY